MRFNLSTVLHLLLVIKGSVEIAVALWSSLDRTVELFVQDLNCNSSLSAAATCRLTSTTVLHMAPPSQATMAAQTPQAVLQATMTQPPWLWLSSWLVMSQTMFLLFKQPWV